jgi:hypothetical protein
MFRAEVEGLYRVGGRADWGGGGLATVLDMAHCLWCI